MLNVDQTVNVNKILVRALSDSNNLSTKLKETQRKLTSLGTNPAKITKINQADGYTVTLQVQESYNSLPAVMSEGYNGGQGVVCYFETEAQAEMLLNNQTSLEFTNLSAATLEAQQLVRLLYNNKHLVVMPVGKVTRVADYRGVIGKAISNILPYETGKIKLMDISQAMDLSSFHKLTIKNFGG